MFASPNFAKAILELPDEGQDYNVIDQLEMDRKKHQRLSKLLGQKDQQKLVNRLSSRFSPSLVSCAGSSTDLKHSKKSNIATHKRPKSQILS